MSGQAGFEQFLERALPAVRAAMSSGAGMSFRSWLRRDENGEWQLVRDLALA